MKTRFAATLIAGLLLAGCSQSPAPASSAASDSQSAAEDQSVSSSFVVGMECNYAPFNWTQLEQNDTAVLLEDGVSYADGYDVVIAQKIAQDLGKELVVKKIAWEGLEPALNSGEIDAIIAGMTATDERRQNADFTTPYYESEMVIIVKGDSELTSITSIQELSGKKVQGQINTIYDEVIDQIEGVQHMTPLANYPLMVTALKSGDVDALTAELPVALGVTSANPDLTIVRFSGENGFLADTTVSIAVKKGNTELFDAVQAALDKLPEEDRLQWMIDATNRQPATE